MSAGAVLGQRTVKTGLLTTGLVSLLSGFLIQICYHMTHATSPGAGRTVWGWDYPTWALLHQVSSAAWLAFTVWHLYLRRKPLLALIGRTRAWRRCSTLLFATFAFAAATALSAWAAAELVGHQLTERALIEVHDKLVLPMSLLLVLHVWQRRARLFA